MKAIFFVFISFMAAQVSFASCEDVLVKGYQVETEENLEMLSTCLSDASAKKYGPEHQTMQGLKIVFKATDLSQEIGDCTSEESSQKSACNIQVNLELKTLNEILAGETHIVAASMNGDVEILPEVSKESQLMAEYISEIFLN